MISLLLVGLRESLSHEKAARKGGSVVRIAVRSCHPERSEGFFLVAQKSLTAFGMTSLRDVT